MFKRHVVRTLPLVAGGVAALSLYTASPAFADGQACYPRGCGDSPAAGARWEDYGDIFYVHDYKADGKATMGLIQYEVPGGWVNVTNGIWNRNGYSGPPVRRNLEVAEGKRVRYMACVEPATSATCSPWKYETNDG